MEFKKTEDYFVQIAKGSGVIEFTEEHLEIHKKAFNPETKPEYFGDLYTHGLEYIDTVRMEADAIDPILQALGVQKYRKGANPKYNQIKANMLGKGFDLRQKPLQLVVDIDGNAEVYDPEYLFNGNTTHSIFSSFTNVQNRLVAIYKKNSYFSVANLILIGGNQNSLDYPSGTVNFDDISVIVKAYLQERGLTISATATDDERLKFIKKIETEIIFAGGNDISLDSNKVKGLIIEILQEQTGVETLKQVKTGAEVLTYFEDTKKTDYIDSKTNKFKAIAANMDKYYTTLNTHSKKLQEEYDIGVTLFKPEIVNTNVIIHMGTPNPSDPVMSFFKTYLTFYKEYLSTEDFVSQKYFHSATKTGKYTLLGAFQQVSELDYVFPYGEVIPFEDIVAEYKKLYPNGNLVS